MTEAERMALEELELVTAMGNLELAGIGLPPTPWPTLEDARAMLAERAALATDARRI